MTSSDNSLIRSSLRFPQQLLRLLAWCHSRHLLSWLVFGVTLALTHQVWQRAQQQALHSLQADFNSHVKEAQTRIEQRMLAYEQVLRGVDGFMSSAGGVNRDNFHYYIGKLRLHENYPGIRGVSFAVIVPPGEKARHIDAMRGQGFQDYAIKPEGEREIYTAIVFREPVFDHNIRAFGYDMYSEPERRTAMDQARDSGQVAISGKVRFLPGDSGTPQSGVVMYLPIYRDGRMYAGMAQRRAGIIGWVYSSFRLDDLMAGLHGERARDLDVDIFDGTEMSPGALLYDSDQHRSAANRSDARFQSIDRMNIAGREWTVSIRSLPGFEAGLDTRTPQLIAAAGIAAGVLLALLTSLLAHGRKRALQTAQRMNRELIDRETRYRQMFEENSCVAYLAEPETGRIVDANPAAAAFWGYSLQQLRGMDLADIILAPRDRILAVMQAIRQGRETHVEWRHRLNGGGVRDVEVFSSPLVYQGKVLLYSILHDVTSRQLVERALQESEARFREITETLGEGVFVTDRYGMIRFSNPEAERLLGWSRQELRGRHGHSLFHHSRADGTPFPAEACELRMVLSTGQRFSSDDETYWRKDGTSLPVSICSSPIVRDGEVVGAVVVFHDVTRRKEAEQRAHHLANFDVLTDLPNRALLNDRLQRALATARRDKTRVALMFIDLDKFKPVNDTLGHDIGDMLLKEVASRIQSCVREADTVARIGGDEFVVLLPAVEDEQSAAAVARKILEVLAQPFELAGNRLGISSSIGIATFPEHGSDENALIKNADLAMYRAKQHGGCSLALYGELAHGAALPIGVSSSLFE